MIAKKQKVFASHSRSHGDSHVADVLYADDTLLIRVTEHYLEAGTRYGMEFHFDKFQMISTSRAAVVARTPEGTVIHLKASMDSLRFLSQEDGQVVYEICRRIAIARTDFDATARFWTPSFGTWR